MNASATTTTQAAYPLAWPAGWPRVPHREGSRFRTKLSVALSELKREVTLLGGTSLVLSSNVTLGAENPADPAVCAYFILRKQHIAIPCDRWTKVCDNVKAIALTIEAMRGMERWGAKHMITAMFQGFAALPEKTGPSCWEVLQIPADSEEVTVMEAYRRKVLVAHPDKAGGSVEAFQAVVAAKDNALAIVKGRKG